MADDFQAVLAKLAALERHVANMVRVGKVEEVKAAGGEQKLRANIGGNGGDDKMMSPWLFTGDSRGNHREEQKYKKGQTVMLVSPGGDFRQAAVFPYAENDKHLRPGHADDESHSYQYERYRETRRAGMSENWIAEEDDKEEQTGDESVSNDGKGADNGKPKRGEGGVKDSDKKALVLARFGIKQDQQQQQDGEQQQKEEPKGAVMLKAKKKGKQWSEDKAGEGEHLFESTEKIVLKVGGSSITITGDQIVIKSAKIITDGATYLGDPTANKLVGAKGTMTTDGATVNAPVAKNVYVKFDE